MQDQAYKRVRLEKRKPLKLLRKTGSSKLAEHPAYKYYAQYYLGHSPKTIADRHYVQPSQVEFDQAIQWLGSQFGFSGTRTSIEMENGPTSSD